MPTITNATLQQNIESLTALLKDSVTEIKDSVTEIKLANASTKAELTEKIEDLSSKFDAINQRFGRQDERIERAETLIGEIDGKVENLKVAHARELQILSDRIKNIEEKVGPLENIPETVQQLKEVVEERTNRQLRETLIFKNIEEKENEKWEDTKILLAKLISETCQNISYNDAFHGIKRCHRESAKKQEQIANNGRPSRAGKRHIYAALYSWDLCQSIIESFRKRGISERNFNVYAEHMYGPLTTKRRGLALELRKKLKEEGTISGGYVAFPAKLFVNRVGNVDMEGKKVYNFHVDFSKHDVTDRN